MSVQIRRVIRSADETDLPVCRARPHRGPVLSLSRLLTFALAGLVLMLIPGPSMLFTIGRAISAGRREALLTVLGNGLGSFTLACAIAFGLGPVIAASALAFTVLKLVGAGYLAFLGFQAFRERRSVAAALIDGGPGASGSSLKALRTAYVVGVTNPKTLVFLAALLPQFVDPALGPVWRQILVLATVLVCIGFVTDSSIALAAGAARDWFARSPRRMERVGGTGGVMMVGLGVALLFTGRPD